MKIVIGSLNCLGFGRAAPDEKVKTICKIIIGEQFDIVALQEIHDVDALKLLLEALKRRSPSAGWRGYGDFGGADADYAFVWKSCKLDLPRTRGDGGDERVYYPRIYNQYRRDPDLGGIALKRPPLYGRFQTVVPGLPKFEIRLINTHIRFSVGKDGKEFAPGVSKVKLRKNELIALTKSVYYRASDKVYGRREGEGSPRTSYTFLLGDYNLNLSTSYAGYPCMGEDLEDIVIGSPKTEKGNKRIVVQQKELTTLRKKTGQEDMTSGEFFANNFDHFSIDENRFRGLRRIAERVNTVEKYCDNDPEKHEKSVSDHVPIKFVLYIRGGKG